MPSPACRPHFQVALPDGNWTNATKFKRLYFYHARKAGVSSTRVLVTSFSIESIIYYSTAIFVTTLLVQGTNLRSYFGKVAAHHGLKFAVTEYHMAEDPGLYNESDMDKLCDKS